MLSSALSYMRVGDVRAGRWGGHSLICMVYGLSGDMPLDRVYFLPSLS